MFDLAIKSKRIITPQGERNGVVLIKDGTIIDIISYLDVVDERLTDVNDKVLMPGVIDPHVHINEPGRTEWEGFDTATKAALAGGVTTLVDMPLNSSPVTTNTNAFEQKLGSTKGRLHTNCGFWGGVIPGNENEIEPLIDKGVLGFKAFLVHSGIDEFPNVAESDLRKAMPIIAKSGLPLLVHCELTSPLSEGEGTGVSRSYQNYLHSRPRKWEDDAIALMIRLCEEYNCRTHIVHLSSSNSIEQIAKAKQKGIPLTVETAQHYLFFDDQIHDGQTQFKCAPPIREKENNEKIWQALKDEIIDFVATDHSPCPPELKCMEEGDFMKAWGGVASLQFALPILWTEAMQRSCTLNDIAKWLSENPAKFAGLNKKGKIEKGFDADIIVWDPAAKFSVTPDIILHHHKTTPYLNEKLFGVVEQTYLSGEKIFDAGKFLHLNKGKIILSQ
ncbi:MAG TPA: allantoinase AllB [Chitinophagaceae bacterium]|nr:allantoinase AllB [Chitinophagaceae bacterium]